jgi:RecB family endonuclease NucS
MHVEGMAVNSTARKHHPNIKAGSEHDLFFKIASGKFRLWNPESDPAPLYRDKLLETVSEVSETTEDDDVAPTPASPTFAYERDLRNYLEKNLSVLEPRLTLYQDEEFMGIEFPVGSRFIDILAVDRNDDFVVIELKVSREHERTIGQILAYMGWVQKDLAGTKKVRGIVVASGFTEDFKLAASRITDIALFEYDISFKLRRLPQPA